MRTVTRTVYTASELREHEPDGFKRALGQHAQWVYGDPAWAGEYRDSLDACLAAIGDDPPTIDGPTRAHDVRRCMAWLENNVLGPLRIPWRGEQRRKLAQYGEHYRPGCVEPCPFTGFHVDDDLLDCLRELAHEGRSPDEWPAAIRDRAGWLWEQEVEDQAGEQAFLAGSDANGWEYYSDGTLSPRCWCSHPLA